MLPVSSSAHLTLLPWLRSWPVEPGRTTLAAGLHAGSCAGICWALRGELAALPRTAGGRRTLALVAATTVPAAAAGWLAADAVEDRLGAPGQVAGLLAGAGVLLALADRRPQRHPVGPREAALAAVAQVLALAPGVSRGGATTTALRAAGVGREDAVRFSLLMSLPISAGAAGLTLVRADRDLLRRLGPALAAGAPAAALAAALAVTRVPAAVLGPAAVYRLVLAATVAHRLRAKGPA